MFRVVLEKIWSRMCTLLYLSCPPPPGVSMGKDWQPNSHTALMRIEPATVRGK